MAKLYVYYLACKTTELEYFKILRKQYAIPSKSNKII